VIALRVTYRDQQYALVERPTIGPAEVSWASESSDGTEAGGEVVLDVALASGLRAADPGFACRTARHMM
jgi:hypothetical protein